MKGKRYHEQKDVLSILNFSNEPLGHWFLATAYRMTD